MVHMIEIKSRTRTELIDITLQAQEAVRSSGVQQGFCHLFLMHTTAGITVNEGADPAVKLDITTFLNKLVPIDTYFAHSEGNSDAHIKSTIVGTSQCVLIAGGQLLLGTWQSLYLCEFDGPRTRKIAVKITADN